ncbi:hypothetical protein ElyMa_004478200 [Elysia marginata]|uniref:VWFD domain-containing protein n=1 Tax=Elysia marginata TaxID=1093978 RepID=A0AAV4HKZ5_9GAST|nr:hypothetical protein ElyMa_004478200 [Elysia marginata]
MSKPGRSLRIVLTVALLYIKFLASQAYTVTTTNGGSGDVCPPGPQCLGDGKALCINNKCRCQPPEDVGLGHFLCVRSNEVFCAIFNDPTIRGYDGSYSFAPLNCKFKPTHLFVPLCDTSDPDNVRTISETDSCDVKVSAWGTRRRGKSFIRGIDVRFMVLYQGSVYHHLSRIISDATGGVYTFLESTNLAPFGSPTSGPAQNTTIPNVGQIYTEYDHTDNFARIKAEMCGVEVGIRQV